MNFFKITVWMLCLACCTSALFGQENQAVQEYEIIVDTQLEGVSMQSMIKPNTIAQPSHGSVSYHYLASGLYTVKYTPNTDYKGLDEFTAEYYVNTGVPTPKYVHFKINVKSSIIRTTQDFVNTDKNTSVDIDALSNDYASHGPLKIAGATYVSDGTVSLNSNGTLAFTPNTDFVGIVYVNYIALDTIGATALGTIKINVQDTEVVPEYELIKIATVNKNPATILLPFTGFSLDSTSMPNQGTVSFVGSDIVEYTSSYGNASLDTFKLVHPNYVREVIVETIYIPSSNGFVQNDYFITNVNTPITFNVLDNDLKKQFPITQYSNDPALVAHDSIAGQFTYTPPADFSGEKNFSYTVNNGIYDETASIRIIVSDFFPEKNVVYKLSTPKNTKLLINYDVPISNFEFKENQAPIHGSINIYKGVDTVDVGCEDVVGYNLVAYTPNQNFVGTDHFELLYCIDGGLCENVKVEVTVNDIGLDSICLCVSNCVWSGDADNDGKVSVADLLPIAYHHGTQGAPREEAGASTTWFGQNADDWEIQQAYNQNDVKHVDANGDGTVAGDDLQDILEHYNRFHGIVAPNTLVVKDFPFDLTTDKDTIYAGDHLNLNISIGSEEYPVLNIYGLAYGLTFPAILIDSSTCSIDFLNDSWFGQNSASFELGVQPRAGRVEAAFSRTGSTATSGYGIVAKVDFVVEEDIQGLKTSEEIIPFQIHLEAMKVKAEDGTEFTLPPVTKTMYLDLRERKTESFDHTDVVLYPNPAQNQIFIHANKKQQIESVHVYNTQGTLIESKSIQFSTARIDVANYTPGIYFAQVLTKNGRAVKKFIVQR